MMQKFDFKKRLGSGNFGEVWLAIDTTLNAERAVKLIPPAKVPDQNNFFREAQILKTAEHPNIVHVHETGLLQDTRIYVAMEYLKKGSLEDEASGGYVPLSRAKRIMVDVLRGLEHTHLRNIIHRDIKPGNILVGNAGEGKLSDFGLAIAGNFRLTTVKEYYAYVVHMAPELFHKRLYSVQSDIYACGVTMYRLVNGDNYLPILPHDIALEAAKGNFPDRDKYREFVPRALKTLINRAMNPFPTERFASANEMRRALEQIPIQMNWQEQVLSGCIRWVGSWDMRCIEIERGETAGNKWYVSVKKGKSKDTMRKINNISVVMETQKKAESYTRRILQDVVLGRSLR